MDVMWFLLGFVLGFYGGHGFHKDGGFRFK